MKYHASECLTFPILGTSALQGDRLAFDPGRRKRRAICREVCECFSEYNVLVGGASSFDVAPKPCNKYYASDLWCKENGYSHDEVVIVGADYGMGGNDGSVYPSDSHFVRIDDYRAFCDVMATWAE